MQLCASLGFLLPTSSGRGQTGIISFGKLPERPLSVQPWHVSVSFSLWLNSVYSLVKESGHWQIVGRLHREAIHRCRKELRKRLRKRSTLNIWMPPACL